MNATLTPLPVSLFVYARPDHTQRTLAALARNPLAAETHLTVYSDAAARPSETTSVRQVRELVRRANGFASVRLIERDQHLGLATSMIAGISASLEQSPAAIFLEDDIVTAPGFLTYMNRALHHFQATDNVMHIAAYNVPVADPPLLPPAFFFRATMCWGWGTWRRAWQHFNADAAVLLAEIRSRRLERAFDIDGSHPYTQRLADNALGRNDSWAIRWYASVFLRGGLSLLPRVSYVQNIGFDGSGTHSGMSSVYDVRLDAETELPELDIAVSESEIALAAIKAFNNSHGINTLQRLRALARRVGNLLRGAAAGQ